MFKEFKTWLAQNRSFLFARYTKDAQETQEPESSLTQLPPNLQAKLVEMVEGLSSNPGDRQAIAEALDESFEHWRLNPQGSDNSLVILSSPVVAVSRILTDTLDQWAEQKQVTIRLVPLEARPALADSIESKLQHYLESEFVEAAGGKRQLEVIVIPNLSWCFLRSIDGLEGIEYLQSRLCDGFSDRFWIIGSGQVGWEYLNSVCNLEAYSGKVLLLPALDAEQLQQWFEPIIEELAITFENPALNKQILESHKDNQTNYFERLAKISNGVSIVAVQAFLKSIHYLEGEKADEFTEEAENSQSVIVAKMPKLPDLPDLESADRYLLYSLLLHGDLTISGLAESLGDEKSEVQARVQRLRHQGVVEQRHKVIKINPIYYPLVKRELANNNFAINKR